MNHSQETNDRALVQLHSIVNDKVPERTTVNPLGTIETLPTTKKPTTPPPINQSSDRDSDRYFEQSQEEYDQPYYRRRHGERDSQIWFHLCVLLAFVLAGGGVYVVVFGTNQFAFQEPVDREPPKVITGGGPPSMFSTNQVIPTGDIAQPHIPQSGVTRIEIRADASQAVVPTTVDQQNSLMLQADEVFSRLKIGWADLQRAEQQRLRSQRRTSMLTKAIATGYMEINAGSEPSKYGKIPLVYVPPGQFMMGQTESQRRESARASSSSHYDFSVPTHAVQVRTGYFIGIYEVPAMHLREFMESMQPSAQGVMVTEAMMEQERDKPACNLDWQTAVGWCQWLSKTNGLTVRLPTEIEWEYAARGNVFIQKFESLRESSVVMGGPWPVNAENLDRSWCGCFGMNSNVQEWCVDAWDENAYRNRERSVTGGRSPAFQYMGFDSSATDVRSELRSVRGSNFRDPSANRDPSLRRYKPASAKDVTVGFRVVVPIPADLLQGDLP